MQQSRMPLRGSLAIEPPAGARLMHRAPEPAPASNHTWLYFITLRDGPSAHLTRRIRLIVPEGASGCAVAFVRSDGLAPEPPADRAGTGGSGFITRCQPARSCRGVA